MTSRIGSLSTVTPRYRAVVVEVDALERRRAPVEHAVVGSSRSPRRSTTLSPRPVRRRRRRRASSSPRRGSGPSSGGAGRSMPVQAHDVLGAGGARAARPCRAPAPSCSAIASRSRVAQRVDVQQQRLLDLGAVEEVAAALRRDLRMVGQEDRGAQHGVVVGAGQHRPGVDVLAARRARAARRSGRRARAARRASRPASAAAPRRGRGRRAPACVFSHPQPDARRLARLDLAARRGPRRRRARTLLARRRRAPRAARRPGGARPSAAGSSTSASTPAAAPAEQALDLQVVEGRAAAGRVRGRVDDAERRRRRVLGRARRVGVERVALVEQRA